MVRHFGKSHQFAEGAARQRAGDEGARAWAVGANQAAGFVHRDPETGGIRHDGPGCAEFGEKGLRLQDAAVTWPRGRDDGIECLRSKRTSPILPQATLQRHGEPT